MPEAATANTHATEPWKNNPAGPRSVDEAVAIAKAHGVRIASDIRFDVADEYIPANAHAAYFMIGEQDGHAPIHWSDFYNRFGQIPVHVRSSVLASDEAIVAVLAHEVYELEKLRELFAHRGGIMTAGELHNLIAPEVPGNLHHEAVALGDALVRAMRKKQ